MRTVVCILIIILTGISNVLAGSSKGLERKYERAEELYSGGSFAIALPMYLELYMADSSNLNICYRLGDCYLKTGASSKKAEYYLQKSIESTSATYNPVSIKER